MVKMNDEEKLKAIYNAFKPNDPADSRYYADCKEARGETALSKRIIKMLGNTQDDKDNLHYLFTGHLGCGKSTELIHLADELKKKTTFFPVYIDFEKYLDVQDTTLEDILLGMISEIAVRCREAFDIRGKEESYSLVKKIGEVFKGFSVKGEVGLPFDIAKLNIEQLRQNPSVRQQVRDAIKDDERRSLFGELNNFILEIELKLKQQTEFTKLIIIADSLEKIKKFEKVERDEDEITSQAKLFLGKQEQLTGIATNVIYTVPLSLYRSNNGKQLLETYGKNIFVLPMVKIHKRGRFDEVFEIGREELIEIINRRLKNSHTSIDEVFAPDALEYLLKYSGGHIRSLIRFVQEALIEIDDLPIDFAAARKSVREEVRIFGASVRESYWAKLAKLETSADQQIENGDPDYSKMLESLAILEYVNGDEMQTDDDVWYAVNPAIRLTIKFQEAVKKLQATQ